MFVSILFITNIYLKLKFCINFSVLDIFSIYNLMDEIESWLLRLKNKVHSLKLVTLGDMFDSDWFPHVIPSFDL